MNAGITSKQLDTRTIKSTAAAQLEFEEYAASGAAALGASTVILHHPHQKLFDKINVTSSPPDVFVAAVKEKMPDAEVHYAQPGSSWP
jgi:hypothetical protein